jgi:hypothetical protein
MISQQLSLAVDLPDDVWDTLGVLTQSAFDHFMAMRGQSIVGNVNSLNASSLPQSLYITATNKQTLDSLDVRVKADGSFVFPHLLEGTYQLTVGGGAVLASGTLEVLVSQSHATEVELLVVDGASLSGFLRTQKTGQAVPNAELTLTRVDGNAVYTTRSGPDGGFMFPDLPSGAYTIAATAVGFAVQRMTFDANDGDSIQIDLLLDEQRTAAGTIRSSRTNLPIANAVITLRDNQSGFSFEARTTSSGHFLVTGLPSASFTIVVAASGFVTNGDNSTDTSNGSTSGIEVLLDHGASIEGTVRDSNGLPVSGAGVSVRTETGSLVVGTTNEFGQFILDGVPPEEVLTLRASGASGAVTEISLPQLQAGEIRRNVQIQMISGA